ncbi:uncharacterized protein RSE6_01999 [Rhynchosporium secalis]|uniref:Uncharacterized protein n=1 Tax=Rhynchosporium secalis TaxID=38038 RepID=A0A1E1LZ69_RHYSE|nr:uncharacterized protein RSE6_01999 [Rhynchosporium secalis]
MAKFDPDEEWKNVPSGTQWINSTAADFSPVFESLPEQQITGGRSEMAELHPEEWKNASHGSQWINSSAKDFSSSQGLPLSDIARVKQERPNHMKHDHQDPKTVFKPKTPDPQEHLRTLRNPTKAYASRGTPAVAPALGHASDAFERHLAHQYRNAMIYIENYKIHSYVKKFPADKRGHQEARINHYKRAFGEGVRLGNNYTSGILQSEGLQLGVIKRLQQTRDFYREFRTGKGTEMIEVELDGENGKEVDEVQVISRWDKILGRALEKRLGWEGRTLEDLRGLQENVGAGEYALRKKLRKKWKAQKQRDIMRRDGEGRKGKKRLRFEEPGEGNMGKDHKRLRPASAENTDASENSPIFEVVLASSSMPEVEDSVEEDPGRLKIGEDATHPFNQARAALTAFLADLNKHLKVCKKDISKQIMEVLAARDEKNIQEKIDLASAKRKYTTLFWSSIMLLRLRMANDSLKSDDTGLKYTASGPNISGPGAVTFVGPIATLITQDKGTLDHAIRIASQKRVVQLYGQNNHFGRCWFAHKAEFWEVWRKRVAGFRDGEFKRWQNEAERARKDSDREYRAVMKLFSAALNQATELVKKDYLQNMVMLMITLERLKGGGRGRLIERRGRGTRTPEKKREFETVRKIKKSKKTS